MAAVTTMKVTKRLLLWQKFPPMCSTDLLDTLQPLNILVFRGNQGDAFAPQRPSVQDSVI